MVRTCVVASCKQEYYPDCGFSFHGFPKDENIRKLWISTIGEDPDKIKKSTVICSKHFQPECFKMDVDRAILKANAVPSVSLMSARAMSILPPAAQFSSYFVHYAIVKVKRPCSCPPVPRLLVLEIRIKSVRG
ncbi:hypothetical protein ACJJTC_014343 [Scirpophaga incertulas]